MNKVILILTILLVTSFSLFAQEDSYDLKVKKMLKLSGAANNFDAAVTNMLDLQKDAFSILLSEEFFEELEKEMLEVGFEKLAPKFTPIYKKHLTEKDLDGIIAFYESEAGKKLAEKTPLILVDAMQVGAEWGAEIGELIQQRIQESNELTFNKVIDQDCSIFKEGIFELTMDGIDEVFTIERENGVETENFEGKAIAHTISWISSNKYALKRTADENDDSVIIEVNIYEVEGNTYKYIAKENGFYSKGEVKKIK